MWNIVIVKQKDFTGHPQQPAKVEEASDARLKHVLANISDDAEIVFMVRSSKQSQRTKGLSLADSNRDMKMMMDHLVFTALQRHRSAVHGISHAANLHKDQLANDARIAAERGPGWKPPEDYIKWLTEQPGAVVSTGAINGLGTLSQEENDRQYAEIYGRKPAESSQEMTDG